MSVCRDTDRTMPISPSSMSRLVPPDEKNGRLMPVLGIVFVTTAMLRIACRMTCTTNPTVSSAPNLSRARTAMDMPRRSSSKNSATTSAAPIKPNSSHRIEKIKSFCGSGTYRYFWRLLPSPSPASPPDAMAYRLWMVWCPSPSGSAKGSRHDASRSVA